MHRLAPPALLLLAALVSDSAAEGHGRVVRIEAARRVWVYVPAGRFVMGVDENIAGYARDQCHSAFPAVFQHPQTGARVDFCDDYFDTLIAMAPREVYVDAFWIDRDEVTVHDYRACVAAGACNLDPLVAGDDRYIRDDWPMVNITWDESQDYCRWRGGRLPTEAEWERAARGDNRNATWPWGEFEQPKDFNHGQPRSPAMREIDRTQAQLPVQMFGDPDDSDGAAVLAPPGSYAWGEGPYGTRDQAGNVAEWTADAYIAERGDKRGYDGLGTINPYREGLANEPRVVRGGSWRQPTFIAKSNLRDPFASLYLRNGRFSHVGFRCSRSARVPHDTGTPVSPRGDTEPKPSSPRK